MSATPQPRPGPSPRPTLVPLAEPKPSHRRFYLVLLLLLAAVVTALTALVERQKVDVEVVSPVRQDIETTVSSSGVVAPSHDYPIRANFTGLIQKIYVHLGQKVKAGQMLVQMKDQYAVPRLDTARAALKESELNLQNAEQNGTQDDQIVYAAELARDQTERNDAASSLATLQRLEQRGSVSESEVANGQRRLKLADDALATLHERMAHRYSAADIASLQAKVQTDKDSLAAERVSWANANISSPVNGTVYFIPVSQFDFVPGGSELMHVADLTQFIVHADFYEADIGKLQVGEPVTILWEGAPDKSWTGKVVTRPMAVNRNGPVNVGQCIISLTGPLGDLPVNSTVTVLVQTQKHSNVLTLPRQALYGSGTEQFVYRVDHGRLRKTPVETGLFSAMNVEITGGLSDRDVVALRAVNGSHLKDGRRIAIAQNHSS
jgi:HlyD family secretion protein